jgi:glycosyltransferase involved in cell wall biosynthesis
LRILFVTEFLPWPTNTGGRIRTFHLLRQAARHHEVTLLTQMSPEAAVGGELIEKMGVRLYTIPFRQRSRAQKAFHGGLRLMSPLPYVSVYSHYRRELKVLIKELTGREHFDVLHLDHLDAALYASSSSSPIVTYLDEHNYETSLLQSVCDHTSKPLVHWYLSSQIQKLDRFERRILKSVDAISVVSANDAQKVYTAAPESTCEIIPNGVDLDFYDIPRDPRPYRVVSVGSLDWLPNVEGLLWFLDIVWPSVIEVYPAATLHIVGRNPQRALLKRASNRITVAGSVKDVREHVRDAAAFVVPLLAGGGTRLRVLEAMAMRIPIVSTSIGVEGIQCTHGQHLLIADRPKEFASQLISILCNQGLAESIAYAGRQLAEQQYSWQVIGNKLDTYYKRMVHLHS